MNIVIDIETKPASKDVLDKFRPVFEEPKTKNAKSAAEKNAEWEEGCTLHAHTSQLVAVGIKKQDVLKVIYSNDEKEMIAAVWDAILGNSDKIIGHYIKGFDLPYLVRRTYINGMLPPSDLIEGRYFSKRVVDTMELWAAGEYKATISLDNLSKALGVGSKIDLGEKMFYQVYAEDQAKALSYLENDLNITWLCAMKMGII